MDLLQIWTAIEEHKEVVGLLAGFAYELIVRLKPTAKSWSVFTLLIKIFALIPDKKSDGTIHTPGKEDKPGTEVTSSNGSTPGTSSLPIVLLVALSALLLASCSRKVAINKSTEHTTTAVQLHTVDTTKSIATVVSTVQSFYGDTLQGSMFLTNDTATGLPLFDSVQSGGIKFKIALQKTLGGYKGLYSIIAKPVSTLSTYQANNTVQQGKDKDSTGSTDTAITTKTKDVQAPAFTFGKLVTIVVILSVVVMLCIVFKPKIYQAFGWVIHKITGNGNHT